MRVAMLATVAALLFSPAMLSGQLPQKPTLTLEAVKRIAAAADAEATRNNWKVVIVIVDEAANLMYLQRNEDVQLGSLHIAQAKARTAALYRRPTKMWADRLAGEGGTSVLGFPDVIPLEGGIPIIVDGRTIGAVGVSGVTSQQDAQIAQAGITALMQSLNR
jgi:glc operon protein GlcG